MCWGKRPWSVDHFVPLRFSFLGHGKLTQSGGSKNLNLGKIHGLATERIRTNMNFSTRFVHIRHAVSFV